MVEHNDNTVLYCRFCGQLNPVAEGDRCARCGAFSGLETVAEVEARARSRRIRLAFLRNQLVRIFLVVVPLIGLVVWVLWAYTDLPPDPPSPTTSIGDTAVPPAPGDWAQARGGVANTGAMILPAQFTGIGPSETAWQHVAGAPIEAPPAVVGDRVYVTAEDGTVTALDRETGEIIWQYESRVTAATTPAVSDGLVFVVFQPGVVSALTADAGNVVWSKRLAAASLPSPTVADGRLFVAETDHKRLLALDAATGDELWRYRLSDWVVAPPVIAGGRLIATSNDSIVHVIDVATGQRQMVYDAGRSRWVRGAATVSDELLHFSSSGGRIWGIDYSDHRYPLDRQILYARTLFWIWGFSKDLPIQRGSVWSTRTSDDQPYPPALAGNLLVVADNTGPVTGLDASTGVIQWETDLGDDITVAPTTAGDLALFGLESGDVVVLSVLDGSPVGTLHFDGLVTASPILAGDLLLVSTAADGGTLFAARIASPGR